MMQLVAVESPASDFPSFPAEAIKGRDLRLDQANGPPGGSDPHPAMPGSQADVTELDALIDG